MQSVEVVKPSSQETEQHTLEYFGSTVTVYSFSSKTALADGGAIIHSYNPPDSYISIDDIQQHLRKQMKQLASPDSEEQSMRIMDSIVTNPTLIGSVDNSFTLHHDPEKGSLKVYCTREYVDALFKTPLNWNETIQPEAWITLKYVLKNLGPAYLRPDPITIIPGSRNGKNILEVFRLPEGAVWMEDIRARLREILLANLADEKKATGQTTGIMNELHKALSSENNQFGYQGVQFSGDRRTTEWYLTQDVIEMLLQKNPAILAAARNIGVSRLPTLQLAIQELSK